MNAGEAAEWTSLILAIAQLIQLVYKVVHDIAQNKSAKRLFQTLFGRWRDLAIFILLLIVFFLLGYPFLTKTQLNVLLTSEAWEAYNNEMPDLAISKAEECINKFEADANSQQHELQNQHAPEPLLGRTPPGRVFQEIIERGSLNDVATCYWIAALAFENKQDKISALRFYQGAKKFSYARCWNPVKQGFWSPADEAASAIQRLQPNASNPTNR
jgi:hypothetical protein